MKRTINLNFDIDDVVYCVRGQSWDKQLRGYREFIVKEYHVRSISIAVNSKRELKLKYRAQQFVNGKTIDYSINFSDDDIGKTVFINKEDAQKYCDSLTKEYCTSIKD